MKRALSMLLLGCLAGGAAAQFRVPGFQTAPPGPAVPAKPAPARGPQLIDRIVAVVNTEVITQRDLAERITLVGTQLKRQGTPPPLPEVLERQVLERMIMDRAQIQFARDTGVRVDDLQVDRTMQLIAENNKLTLADFRRTLEREGVSFDRFREDIRNEIVISRLREREVDSKIQIGESEIENFLQELQAGDAGTQFDLSHILVRVPESASPEQVDARLRRAQEALAKARGGADFAQLAVSYSDAPDALKGGGMGWRERDRLPELFAEALVKLKPGEVSDVLRSPAGFHIVRLNDRRGGGGSFMAEQTRARHILARVSELVSETEARRKITVLRQRIAEGTSFAELARLNSDDTASAQRGGELGWTVPGDLVPEFERAMNALKIGELSQPVRTPFGYHIIQVEERRTADLAADRKRIEARRVLRDRRADEAYQEWLRQLRDRSYVDYRLEER
ncbi:MAG TPA: peptidylprolyl isomerase [Burkholderiales bacterium]|nr:peptidylprolyl isomerase [Burkholderiales bacterium]